MRWSYLFWLVIAAAAATALFETKHKVQLLEEDLLSTQRQIQAERERIEVLRAEWSYLNRPSRIAALAKEHLGLASMTPDQIVTAERLPPRPEDFGRVPVSLDDLLPPTKPEQFATLTITPVSEIKP